MAGNGHACMMCGAKNGNGKSKHALKISEHHLAFTNDAMWPNEPNNKGLRDYYRSFKAHLCMTNHGSMDGCHNQFNEQIRAKCCGVQNIPIEGDTYRVLIGICPLISGKPPLDQGMTFPNEFCQYCFYFQAIASPDTWIPFMKLVSQSKSYDGKVSSDMLYEAQDSLLFRGVKFEPVRYQISCTTRTLWKPIA